MIRVAVVGCGYWGINYVRVLSELPETEVAVVCDQRQERLDEVQRRFPYAKIPTCLSLDEALADYEFDAAVVCVPAVYHYGVAAKLLQAGKHVLVEKPLTTEAEDSQKLIDLAEMGGLKLVVGHIFVYNPGIQKIKSLIAHEDFGRLYYLYAKRTNLGPIRYDVDALWDLATHDVSIFNYFMGGVPEWVSAVGSSILQEGINDVGFAVLHYPNNVLGQIHVSWADPHKERELVIVGSEQRISFNDLNPQERVRVFNKGVTRSANSEPSSFGEYNLLMRDGDIISPSIAVNEPLKAQVQHFAQTIEDNFEPITDGQAGLDVVRVLDAIQKSIRLNGAPVEVASTVTALKEPTQ